MKIKMFVAGLLALGTVVAAVPASAQNIVIGPDGVRIMEPRGERGRDSDRRRPDRREISEREAVRIARGEGVREVDSVRRTSRAYRILGVDRRGRDIRVDVDRRDGDVLSVR
ncbi:hypothetical protein Sa4125_38890 [Aureimonas sp. SA4125]|nr:hypothetical protein Sa4125_38890 [Aureimonas sp. SA4125]